MRKHGWIITLSFIFLLSLALFGGSARAMSLDYCPSCGSPMELEYPDTQDGTTYIKCTNPNCGMRDEYCMVHVWEQVNVSLTTCTEDGFYEIECADCKFRIREYTDKAYGHNWGDWQVQNPVTCLVDGSDIRWCEECHAYETRAVKATGHKWGNWQAYTSASCTTDGTDIRYCQNCSVSETRAVKATGHKWGEWQVYTSVSCTADGTDIRYCLNCAESETRTVKATGHKWSEWTNQKPATCYEEGTDIRRCSTCNSTETRNTPKLEHTWSEWDLQKPPTCTQEGVETSNCIYCWQHNIINAETTKTRSVAPTGHNWGEWKQVKAPSCKEEGLEERKCTNANDTISFTCTETETRPIPKTDHEWGEWEVTKEAFHNQPGEETRRCKHCDAEETRATEAEKPLAKVGDSSFEVLIAQQLLNEMEFYDGPVDGSFSETLVQALKSYAQTKAQAAKEALAALPAGSEDKALAREREVLESISTAEEGALYTDVLEYLSWHYLKTLDPQYVPEGASIMGYPDSGLRVSPVMDTEYKQEESGTHQVFSQIKGLLFSREGESQTYTFPRGEGFSVIYEAETYTEACLLGADNICTRCGQEVKFELVFSLPDFKGLLGSGGSFVLRLGNTSLEDLGLPYVEKLEYQEIDRMLHWDSFPEAAGYRVWIYNLDQDEEKPVETCELVTSCCHPVSETYAGHYAAMVQALGANGEAISNPTVRYYDITENLMPMPENVVLRNAYLSWEYPYEDLNPFYQISIYQDIPGSGESRPLHFESTTRHSLNLVDLYVQLAVKGVEPGSSIRAEICVQDGDGSRIASYVAVCSEPWVTPDFYRTLALVNVRSGPGKSFSRIGSYRAGTYLMSYGTEMGADGLWVIISYRGETGYIKASSLAWFAPRIFHVNVDAGKDHTGKQVTVSVSTNPDGTISREDLENKVSKYGYVLESLSWKSGSGSGKLDMNTPLSPGDGFTVNWEKDPEYVFVKFKDEKGKPVEVLNYFVTPQVYASEIPIRLYSTFSIRTKGDTCPGWYYVTYNEKVDVYDDTLYTSNKDTIIMYERTEQQITLGKQTLLKEGYDSYLNYLFTSRNTSSFTPAQMWEYVRTVEGKHAFRLQAGDVITLKGIYGEQGANDLGTRYYKVYHERLKKEGYIFAALLDKQQRASYVVYFDPGLFGNCDVYCTSAKIWPGSPYAYPTLEKQPTAAKEGELFLGWCDEAGKLVTPDYEFTKDTTLQARYESRDTSYLYSAVITTAGGDKKPLKDQIQPYGYAHYGSKEKMSLVVGEEVLLIRSEYNYAKKTELYQCVRWDYSIIWVEPRFVVTGNWYTKVVLPKYNSNVGLMVDPDKDIHVEKVGSLAWIDSYDRFGSIAPVKLPGQSEEQLIIYVLNYGNDIKWEEINHVIVPNIRGKNGESLGGGIAYTCTAHDLRSQGTALVRFDPGEGVCAVDKVEVPVGGTLFGKFPQAVWKRGMGGKFIGWFTDPILGVAVSGNDVITRNRTLYAHYSSWYDDFRAALEKTAIYEYPGNRGEKLDYIQKGETVEVTRYPGKTYEDKYYYYVRTKDGAKGYVASDLLTDKGTRMYFGFAQRSHVDQYIRSQPKYGKGTAYRLAQPWETFLVIGEEKAYYKVAFPECKDGFAYIAKEQMGNGH